MNVVARVVPGWLLLRRSRCAILLWSAVFGGTQAGLFDQSLFEQ
ncbi:hypothetical protein [Streptomyces sp. NPDC050704]